MVGAEGPSCVDGVCSLPGEVAPAPVAPETRADGDGANEGGDASSEIETPWQN